MSELETGGVEAATSHLPIRTKIRMIYTSLFGLGDTPDRLT